MRGRFTRQYTWAQIHALYNLTLGAPPHNFEESYNVCPTDTVDARTNDQALRSCAMIITEPNKFVAEVHDRMPVVPEADQFERWTRGDAKDAATLMKPAAEDVLQKWPVSKRINSSRAPADDPTLVG